MPIATNRCVAAALIVAGGLGAAAPAAHHFGYRINATASAATGVWRVSPVSGPLMRGNFVSICPPSTSLFKEARERHYLEYGECPGGFEPLLKPIAALAGDTVECSANGLAVNGFILRNSRSKTKDRSGRALSPCSGRWRVAADELWLVSEASDESFDSRYFGAVPKTGVIGVAAPIWTQKKGP